MAALITIAEVPEFVRRAARLLSSEERMALLEYIAANPRAGDLISGTGGVRKLRWARGGRGKSAGVRVIYSFTATRCRFTCSPCSARTKEPI